MPSPYTCLLCTLVATTKTTRGLGRTLSVRAPRYRRDGWSGVPQLAALRGAARQLVSLLTTVGCTSSMAAGLQGNTGDLVAFGVPTSLHKQMQRLQISRHHQTALIRWTCHICDPMLCWSPISRRPSITVVVRQPIDPLLGAAAVHQQGQRPPNYPPTQLLTL